MELTVYYKDSTYENYEIDNTNNFRVEYRINEFSIKNIVGQRVFINIWNGIKQKGVDQVDKVSYKDTALSIMLENITSTKYTLQTKSEEMREYLIFEY